MTEKFILMLYRASVLSRNRLITSHLNQLLWSFLQRQKHWILKWSSFMLPLICYTKCCVQVQCKLEIHISSETLVGKIFLDLNTYFRINASKNNPCCSLLYRVVKGAETCYINSYLISRYRLSKVQGAPVSTLL